MKTLVLSRRVGESIEIAHEITITVLRVRGRVATLAIKAPANIPIRRSGNPNTTDGENCQDV